MLNRLIQFANKQVKMNKWLSVILVLLFIIGSVTYYFYQKNLSEKYEAHYLKSDGLYEAKDYKKAIPLYETLAEDGFDKAQNRLGEIYFSGIGTHKNEKLAMFYWQKAAEQGNDQAQINLAKNAFNKANYDESFKWYKLASKSGDAFALAQLGNLYQFGLGTEIDHKKAYSLYLDASQKGDGEAYFQLGKMYEMGVMVSKDEPKAIYYYQQSAERKHPKALYRLGELKKMGEELEMVKFDNYVLLSAKDFFREACLLGEKEACGRE